MTGFIMLIHALVCACLVFIILMQSGRGGGLTEGFASAESMFGAKTSSFLVKGTTVLASVFLVTCLSLAVMSARKSQSLMEGNIALEKKTTPVEMQKMVEEAVPAEAVKTGDTAAPEAMALPEQALPAGN